MKLTGRCGCGKVSYEMLRRPMFVNCCNCTYCQRETGGAFAVNAVIETSNLEVSGEVAMYDTPSASGYGQTIVRCQSCGIALYSHYAGAGPSLSFVKVGTMDNPDLCPPQTIIYKSTQQKWLCWPEAIPQFDEYYDMKTVWPPESLERRAALKEEIKAWRASLEIGKNA